MAAKKKSSKKKSTKKTPVEFVEATQEEIITDYQTRLKMITADYNRLQTNYDKLSSGTLAITRAIEQVFKDNPTDLGVPKMPKRDTRSVPEYIPILHLSDLQIGKTTPTYNVAVARERMYQIGVQTIDHIEKLRATAKVERVIVLLGGDVIEGEEIFPHQAHLIDAPLIDQAVRTGPEMIARMILHLLEYVRYVDVYSVPGNHGRSSATKRGHPATNWDTVTSETIKYMLVGPEFNQRKELADRLKFYVTDDFYQVIRLWGWGVLAVHGHQIKGGFGGFPFYGVGKKVAGWADSINVPWDYLMFGHFHTYGELTINSRVWMCNGSSESDNEFARECIASQNTAVQRLAIFEEANGYKNSYALYLEPRTPQSKRFHNYAKDMGIG